MTFLASQRFLTRSDDNETTRNPNEETTATVGAGLPENVGESEGRTDEFQVGEKQPPRGKKFNLKRSMSRIPSYKSSYSVMLVLLILATLGAVAQHIFYSYLHGRQPDNFFIDQVWVIRIGAALAYLVKSALVTSVAISFYQRCWFSLQRVAVTVDCIDALFGILQNPLRFLSRELLVKTKIVTVLALICWCLPLSAIFTPGTLTGTSLLY
jgi:hypothetical protein